MYSSNSISNFETFKTLTRTEAFGHENIENRKYLEKVIKEAHNFLINEIQEKDLSFDVYDLVMKISKPDKKYLHSFLKEVEPNNITKEDLITLVNVLYSLKEGDSK